MVLSDNVARTRPGEHGKGGGANQGPDDRRLRRQQQDGPFGGMNQTVAGIDPTRQRPSRPAPKMSRQDSSEGVDVRRKALKMQGVLATVPYSQRNKIKDRMSDFESFDDFDGLMPVVREAIESEILRGMVNVKPTPVQKLAIPALLGQEGSVFRSKTADAGGRGDFLLAAETGSGKTMAYLLPVVHALKEAELADADIQAYRKRMEAERALAEEQQRVGSGRGRRPGRRRLMNDEPSPTMARPRVVILVPTAELVDQVGHVAKLISHKVKFRVERISATVLPQVIQRNVYSPSGIDMLVATPNLLASMADSDPNILSQVRHLVIDEADSLLDRSFGDVTTGIIDRTLPSLRQLILCTATVPRRLDNYIALKFPDTVRITTPNLHAVPRRVQLGVIDVEKEPYRGNRLLACADVIYTIGKEAAEGQVGRHDDGDEVDIRSVLVFVNERESTQPVAEYLRSKGINAVAFHRDTSELRLTEMLASFTTPEPQREMISSQGSASRTEGGSRRFLPNVRVIVGTDLISRGIDTLAVRHVILFDVPHTAVDFIHRLGRAGRMNRRGRGIVLVGDKDRRDIVAEVKESMFMGQALI